MTAEEVLKFKEFEIIGKNNIFTVMRKRIEGEDKASYTVIAIVED